ncbi:hypothetical protein MJO28_010646 [Puccinia striiformis f. sp. tritici]|uniref:Uncharacterized protein n=1 Tax=Puccinia striiformis f. sp. tritici TaxID=168172 RepID=A0ACC0E5L9_9BASI|nr:hypothetical protein MJO28_010646 [Puccinia striiformis f. sp. tritici]
MVATTRRSTRTTKEALFGPLQPPTRRRPGPSILERRRKLELRRLSKLPPLPPTPPSTPPSDPNSHPRLDTDSLVNSLTDLRLSTPQAPSVPQPPIKKRPPSPFISEVSHIFSEFLNRHPILQEQSNPRIPTPIPSPMSATTTVSEPTPKAKFLQQPSVYKQDVEALLADGSNFNCWKRGLTRIIHLCLGHEIFFDDSSNYTKICKQEQTCLLFLIQITVHDELASLVDRFSTGTEAYDTVQTNFQGSVRFRQIELVDKLLEFKVTGPSTEPNQMAGLFNRIFEVFADLQKVGAGLSPTVESLVLQAICPTPSTMSRSQLFQNISLQLGAKKDVTARDIQTIVTSAYGESLRFDGAQTSNVTVFRTWPTQPQSNSTPWAQSTTSASWGSSRPNPIRPPQRNPFQQQSRPNPNPNRQQNVGRPGHPTVEDISAAINNIRKGNTSPNDPTLFIGKPCVYCEGQGHWRSFCPTLRRDANLPPPNTPITGCPASGFARQATLPNDPPTSIGQGLARSAVGADATSVAGAGTVLDSGATHHVSGSFHSFFSLFPINPPVKLNLASSTGSMLATHSGHLRIINGDGTLTIPRVLYSPEMTGTLLSLGQLLDSGFRPRFLTNNDIQLVSDQFSLTAYYHNRSWLVLPNSFSPLSHSVNAVTRSQSKFHISPSYEWHCRLGHVSDAIVKDFLKRFVPNFDLKSWAPFICESCKIAKSERRRHSLPEVIPRENKLDLLVTDVLGPLDPDVHGNRFLLTVGDHATTYSFVFPMKSRSEVPHILIALIKKITAHFGFSPKYIRSDNAKEYTVKPLSDYLLSIGSQLIFTSPYTPEQNGEAERLNRTLGDIARTTLNHSQLPSNLWTYAYRCACYLVNRLSNQRCSTSPLELWSGRLPNAVCFYPFGARANVHIPKERRRKMDQRGWTGYLVGYQDDEQGWFFWNPDTQKIVNSECADFLDFQGKPLIPSPTTMTNNILVRRVLHLGQEKTKEICEEQDTLIDNLQAISGSDIPTSLKNALKSPAAPTWKTACLDDPIEETIYVDPPVELLPHLAGKVLRLKKALYGTRQASRCWWKHFKNLLHGWGFQCDKVEECLYRYKKDNHIIIIWIHVDDGIVFSNDTTNLTRLRQNMENELRVKWDSKPEKLVGIKLEYEANSIFLSQHLLINQVIDKFKSQIQPNIIPTYTPLPSDDLVTSWGDPVDPTLYQSFIGSINYMALGTRPDLSYAVNYLARFSANPNETHWAALRHLIQYIATTRTKQLRLQVTNNQLINWTDANWGGEFQRSTSGFIIYFLGSPIAWGSRRQKVVATSTCAAEFIALGSSVDFLLFLIPIIKSLDVDPPIVLKCDNRAAVLVSDDNASKGRMKSLERNFFFVNDAVREHNIQLDWVSTSSNIADFFTKSLRANLHSISLNKIFK